MDKTLDLDLCAEHFNDRADWPMALNINMAAHLGSEVEGPRAPPVLESLNFAGSPKSCDSKASPLRTQELGVGCPLCQWQCDGTETHDDLLKHLLQQHKLVIADVNMVANFKKYIDYWRQRFQEAPMTDFCSVIKTNTKETDVEPEESYFLLCDALPEDKTLRVRLQQENLEEVLAQQQMEREDTASSHDCLFCRQHFDGCSSAEVFNHMARQHGFNVGLPDNLVYTSEFLQLLQSKLSSLQCLYCERTFRDRNLLKEHMRKKLHKRINSKNAAYDKFYVINYLELGKNWKTFANEEAAGKSVDRGDEDGSDNSDWEDWREDSGAQTVCLFCDHKSTLSQSTIHHMKDVHQFDLVHIKETMALNFYQQMKMINYIRRQMHQCCCIQCQERFVDHATLMRHMGSSGHLGDVLDIKLWDQPQYYFPTYEDDNLLCALDVDDDETCQERPLESDRNRETVVIAEDVPMHDSILSQRDVRMKIMS